MIGALKEEALETEIGEMVHLRMVKRSMGMRKILEMVVGVVMRVDTEGRKLEE